MARNRRFDQVRDQDRIRLGQRVSPVAGGLALAPGAHVLVVRAPGALAANVAVGAAGSAAVGAAVLWFTGAHGRFTVTPRIDGDAGLEVSGRF